MVSQSDYFTNLFKTRAGLVEAELVPLFEMQDLIAVSSLSSATRKLFDPKSSHHINFGRVFKELF